MRKYLLLIILAFSYINAFAQDFILKSGNTVHVYLPKGQKPVTNSAFEMLSGDIKTVLNSEATLVKSGKKADIICKICDTLQVEGFKLMVTKGKLHIYGADSHGLAYGLLEY